MTTPLAGDQRRIALTIACPYCDAEPGVPCRNKHTGADLEHVAAHPVRLTRAAHDRDAEETR